MFCYGTVDDSDVDLDEMSEGEEKAYKSVAERESKRSEVRMSVCIMTKDQ